MQSKIIGVTGISGSGASTVAGILSELGGYVISADKLAHRVMKIGHPAYLEIIDDFGNDVLTSDMHIDRKKLGKLVFGEENKEKLRRLESIIHPYVVALIDESISTCNAAFVVIDAPLLIESGLYKKCCLVIFVTAPFETRLQRIVKRDSIDIYDARKRIASRKNEHDLMKYCHIVVQNSGCMDELRKQVMGDVDHMRHPNLLYEILREGKKYTFPHDFGLLRKGNID